MPYASDKQRRFMHARHPEIASRWDAEIRAAKRKKRITKADRAEVAQGAGTALAGAGYGSAGLLGGQALARRRQAKRVTARAWEQHKAGQQALSQASHAHALELGRSVARHTRAAGAAGLVGLAGGIAAMDAAQRRKKVGKSMSDLVELKKAAANEILGPATRALHAENLSMRLIKRGKLREAGRANAVRLNANKRLAAATEAAGPQGALYPKPD